MPQMIRVADGEFTVPKTIHLPCGARAHWDGPSDSGYRCANCFAIVGSIGQPRQCAEESEKYKAIETLGGAGWDYTKGRQKNDEG